jgi:DNA modification methylase
MRIERIAVSRLNPAAYNPRLDLKPGDAEYGKLKRSLDEFGLVEPIVWNRRTGHIVGGHQRFKLLLARGDKNADVSVVDLSLEREKALNLALNRIAGGWDEAKLADLLNELVATPDFDMSLTGFDPPEVEDLLAGVLGVGGNAGADGEPEKFDAHAAMLEADEAKGPTVTRPGEMLALGEHRLWCGDCADAAGVAQLMTGGRAVLFATDPPYLVNYDGTNHFTSNRSNNKGTRRALSGFRAGSDVTAAATPRSGRGLLRSDADRRGRGGPARGAAVHPRCNSAAKDWSGSYGITWDDADANSDLYERFIEVAIAEAIHPGAPWYCWHASKRQAMLESVWNRFGAFVHQQIIWVKNRPVLTRSFYTWQHEPCLMGWIKGNQPKRVTGEPMRSTVWTADIPSAGGAAANPIYAVSSARLGAPVPMAAAGTLSAEAGDSGGSGGAVRSGGRPDHPTPKPLILFETPMRQHTRVGDVVYEPFCGSGTQLIAAERLKRRCRAVEISPRYCDVIVRRWLASVPPERAPRELVKRYLAGVKAAAVPAASPTPTLTKPRRASSVAEVKPMKRAKSGVRAKKGARRG